MNIAHLLKQSVQVQTQTGSDGYGKPAWAAQRTVPVAIRQANRRVPTANGIAIVPATVLMTDQAIATGDRYWPPGANTSDEKQARIFGVVRSQTTLDGSYTLFEVDL